MRTLSDVMDQFAVTPMPQDAAKSVQEKQLLLSRLLARLAHEIRNPLSSLDIHTQLLEEDLAHAPPAVKARSAARFRTIRTEIERLNNLVKQFLSLAGRNAINPQSVDVARVADHVCALLRPEAAAHGIAISAELPSSLPPVTADPDQLTQALVNLVLNAVQAVGRDGQVLVSAGLTEGGDAMRLTVADTGPGIEAEHMATLFEPFFTTKDDGSGLGLWIVRQIAVAHGGSIDAANSAERGAIFTLSLPLQGTGRSHG